MLEKFKTAALLFGLFAYHATSSAASSRTIYLNDDEMAPIFVELGFSTLLKFDSHPEPGLIGDQDAFKIEYLKSIVAIKPLVSKSQTNLFVFTKDGQFGFKLVAARGRHDNLVFIRPSKSLGPKGPTATKSVVEIDDLLTRKIGKVVQLGGFSITFESVATPQSRSTIILKASIRQKVGTDSKPQKLDVSNFEINQGKKTIKIENAFFETSVSSQKEIRTSALILIRSDEFKRGELANLVFKTISQETKAKPALVAISFSAELR